MKTYRVFGIALVTGKKAELDKLDYLTAGTHHVHQSQPKGIKRPRKRIADMEPTGDSNIIDEQKVMEAMSGMEDKPVMLYGGVPLDTELERVKERNREARDMLDKTPPKEAPHVSD